MSRLNLYFLGPPRIEMDEKPLKIDRYNAIALLAYLAVTGKSHRRDSLLNILWPDHEVSRARALLRRNLHTLNRDLGDWLDVDRESVGLNPDADVWLDVDQFKDCLGQCLTHNHPRSEVCPTCVTALSEALELYHDDFMTGFSLKDSVVFDDWQFFQTEELRSEFEGVLEKLVKYHRAKGDYEQSISYARRWLGLDRLNERVHYYLIQLYAWSGGRKNALRQYEECEGFLRDKLGVSPLESTVELYKTIKENRLVKPPVELEREKDSFAVVPGSSSGFMRGENRNVTVLCLELGGLVEPLEDISLDSKSSAVSGFLGTIKQILTKFGAEIDRSLGKNVLVVFGTTKTREDDPELAIRAAMEINLEAKKLELGVALGIDSGRIYFDIKNSAEDRGTTIMGKVVNLAMGLALRAEVGTIIVGETIYRHTRGAFEFAPLSLEGKGIDDPVAAYKVIRLLHQPRKARGIEGLKAKMIGRDEEFDSLKEAALRWLSGEGGMVSVIGEAGVGKSRLISELKEHIQDKSQVKNPKSKVQNPKTEFLWLEGRCLELGATVSYWPFIDILRAYFSIISQESDSLRGEIIVSTLSKMVSRGDIAEERGHELGPFLGEFLSLQFMNDWDEKLKSATPQQIKNGTFMAFRDFLIALAKRQPVILVLEDLHWADNLSLDLISFLMDTLQSEPIFILCSYRPEREHNCRHLGTIASRKCPDRYSEINLSDLDPKQSRQLVGAFLPIKDFPPSVIHLILEKAQGNPLFLEEIMRSLIDSGMVFEETGTWRAREGIESVTVSESVQSVILSRVDRLGGEVKSLLQIAAVIGHLFPRMVLEKVAISSLGEEGGMDLDSAIGELESLELVYKERVIPEEEYSFKHVLTQETVYANIPGGRRLQLHRMVAEAIEGLYLENVDNYYEWLAYHYDKSNDIPKAMDNYFKAGEKAKRVSANDTAYSLLMRGLKLIDSLPDTPERAQKELSFLISLGPALMANKGYGAAELERVYTRARELCQDLGNPPNLFPILYRTSVFFFIKSQPDKALEQAEEFLVLAQSEGDHAALLQGHLLLGATLFYIGEFVTARKHLEEGFALYDPEKHRSNAFTYGQEPGVNCLTYLTLVLWFLGYPDQALKVSQETIALSEEASHPFSLAHSQAFVAILHQFRHEENRVKEQAGEAIALSADQGFPLWLAIGRIVKGWALGESGEVEKGIEEISWGLDTYRATGAEVSVSMWIAILAQTYLGSGQVDEGLKLIDQAQTLVENSGECMWQAEIYRLEGELLLSRGAGLSSGEGEQGSGGAEEQGRQRRRKPEACFNKSLEVARRQGAKSLELRAAVSLSRLWSKQGKKEEARDLLGEIYGWFTEGFDTADLKEAKILLDSLS